MSKRGRPPHPDVLTPREWEVLALLRERLSNPEIADRLGISRDGVKFHVSEILTKLGVESREEAASWREERRSWWAVALAPFALLWRKAGWALGGAVLVGAVAGLAVLAALVWRGGDGAAPAHRELAYLASNGSLWLVDADSDTKRKLSDDGTCGQFSRLEWSPKGDVIACIGSDGGGTFGAGRIMLRDAAGSVIGQIEEDGLDEFHWSPAGDTFLYGTELFVEPPSTGERRYRIADTSGRQIADLGAWDLSFLPGVAWYGFPLWSPNGDEIAYRPANDAVEHRYSLVSGDRTTLSTAYPLAFAVNGQAEIIATDRQPAASEGALPTYKVLLRGNHNGEGQRLMVLDNGTQFWLSPDHDHIVYLTLGQRADGLPGLGVLDLRSGEAKPIKDSIITYPSDHIPQEWVNFSPDGQFVYWVGGDNAGYRARIDGTEVTRVVEVAGVYGFDFSPDFALVAHNEFGQDPSGDLRVTLRVSRLDGSHPLEIDTRVDPSQGVPFPYAWRP